MREVWGKIDAYKLSMCDTKRGEVLVIVLLEEQSDSRARDARQYQNNFLAHIRP